MRAWHTCTRPCLAADSLPGSRLLNPEVLQFPHPQKCSHLLPEALFSFQGCCGWGGWAGSTDVLSYLTWSSNDWPSWAKPSCSCLLHPWQSTSLSYGCSPCQAVPQQIGKEGSSCREDRVGQCCVWVFSFWRTGNRPEEFMAMKVVQGP